jgi:hypothetical protein
MDNEIVIIGENMMMGPKWLNYFFKKSFSWTMLNNSKNIVMEWESPPPPTHPIVVNNIVYLLCGKLGYFENKSLLKKTPLSFMIVGCLQKTN